MQEATQSAPTGETPRKRIKDLSPEELRAYKRASMKKHRDSKRAEQISLTAESREEWWSKNRQALPVNEVEAMKVQHERCLDQMHWTQYGHNVDPSDEDFVSLAEGTDDLIAFVKENESPHLGYIMHDSQIPHDWSEKRFWADSELLKILVNEGPATEKYVGYGYLSGIPDWLVVEFLTKRAGWTWQKAADLVGYKVDHTGTVSYP